MTIYLVDFLLQGNTDTKFVLVNFDNYKISCGAYANLQTLKFCFNNVFEIVDEDSYRCTACRAIHMIQLTVSKYIVKPLLKITV
jgi:hypothetical protein